jgi:hypothetical protein
VLGLDPLPCDDGAGSVATMDDLFSVPLVAQTSKTGA